ncbi:hypothetical protein H4S08_001509 [Coemansia sp. RSA 1365]|nr:hypothetical protein H4S08_001509 [Coemansia sp. RSA 1365]
MKFAAGIFALTAVAFNAMAAPLSSEHYTSTTEEHYLRTFTNVEGYTMLIDEANTELGGLIVGESGIDGIYNAADAEPASGIDTWVDVHDGVNAVIDYKNPNFYTVYNSNSIPIATVSQSLDHHTDKPTAEVSHYMMTFVNEANSATLLIDQAVTNAAILEVGKSGVDGIYTIPPGGVPSNAEATGTATWVDSADGYVAVIDNAKPTLFTVYDTASNPIHTVSY